MMMAQIMMQWCTYVLQRCEEVNLKLNKEKCHFRCTSIPFFGEVISRREVQPDPQKIKALMDMPPPNNKKSSKYSWALLTILVNFLQVPQRFVIHSKNWHQVRWHGHGMQLSNHYLPKWNYLQSLICAWNFMMILNPSIWKQMHPE